jgi:hypothetical protein
MLRAMFVAFRRTSMSALQYVSSRMMRRSTYGIPRKDLEYIHDEVIKHMTMLRTQRVKPIKYYQLHIVVGLLHDKVNEGSRSSCP